MKIGHPKNFWGGVLFAVIGGAFALIAKGLKLGDLVLVQGYAMGSPARMGPAFFPYWLGLILLALGLLIAFTGFREKGGEEGKFPTYHWQPILYVLGAVVLFGLILRPAGMLISGLLLVMVAAQGNPEKTSFKSNAVLAVALVIFCALVFVGGLKLPIPLCPDIEALQSAIKLCRG
jgi:putative tricarboxylic transport membrane protein